MNIFTCIIKYIFNFDFEKYTTFCFDALDLICLVFQILTAFAFE